MTDWLSRLEKSYADRSKAYWDEILTVVKEANRVRGLFLPALLHGDLEHQAWLKKEIDSRFAPFDKAIAALRAKVEGMK